ncbi:hypothetical protein E3O06_14880 [Cryobacterium glaciale]|uniref:Lipoprotein n=1 Tax=Cryobacterium glaciale TaxID=1259145 RepID=A0A4R8UR83_9MICO|nr:hypothetical protein [Cryobacterium glaciale]TFB69613.1 hypothetical protein E3O06_14880 [Cryobacterium glaciale]
MRIPPRRRPVHRVVTTAGILFLIVTALSGCSATPAATPAPSGTAAPPVAEETAAPPVFASNDEALAAAEAAYSEYQQMSNQIAHEGGADPDRIAKFTVGTVLESELGTYGRMAADGLRLVGDLAFDSLTLQSANLESGALVAYVCLDVTKTDVLDVEGASVIPVGRPNRYPLQVSLLHDSFSNRLFVEKSDSWSGSNFC